MFIIVQIRVDYSVNSVSYTKGEIAKVSYDEFLRLKEVNIKFII